MKGMSETHNCTPYWMEKGGVMQENGDMLKSMSRVNVTGYLVQVSWKTVENVGYSLIAFKASGHCLVPVCV